MVRKSVASLSLLVLFGGTFAPVLAQEEVPAELKTVAEKVSYGIGQNLGRQMKQQPFQVSLAALVRGISDAFNGAEPALTEKDLTEAFAAIDAEIAAAQASAADMRKKEGEDFLVENAKKEGVKTTKSGLQYEVLKAGDGETPKPTSTVSVHYTGTLIDGTVFDSSVERGEPLSIPANRVIQGWQEALQLMKVGDKFRLFIPSELGYGEQGAGGDIPPNSVLIFEVELLGIDK